MRDAADLEFLSPERGGRRYLQSRDRESDFFSFALAARKSRALRWKHKKSAASPVHHISREQDRDKIFLFPHCSCSSLVPKVTPPPLLFDCLFLFSP